ncbi:MULTISPECIES: hypothetical protein [unclassified Streptomyces]|uniref:hypothetical protein n=1 Tax=unclassified Streptomyces TaxID=2593676 RepID=UPI002E135FF6|nr:MULTISPECIES: hypothetical protein [unclassified Streptomyces]WSR24058.1 hypothetical protein OG573_36670 [Streptomyces sp. NBC_01205]
MGLIRRILDAAPSHRAMAHAVAAVHRAKGPVGRALAEILSASGTARVRKLLAA